MPIYRKINGSWSSVANVHTKVGGEWKPVEKVHIHTGEKYRAIEVVPSPGSPAGQVVDDFERSSSAILDPYQDNVDDLWKASSNAHSGSQALRRVSDAGDDFSRLHGLPDKGLNYYPQFGDHVRWYVWVEDWSKGGLVALDVCKDPASPFDTDYRCWLWQNQNRLRIEKRTPTGETDIVSETGITYPSAAWLQVDLIMDNGAHGGAAGDMTLSVTRESDGQVLKTVSGNDPDPHDYRGIGYLYQFTASSPELRLDDVSVVPAETGGA